MTVMKSLLTIVRYDRECRPEDRYPREIISPANRSPCCSERMERIGKMQVGEAGWPFFYKRCQICGYAVREFLGYEQLTEYFLKKHRRRREGLKSNGLALMAKAGLSPVKKEGPQPETLGAR